MRLKPKRRKIIINKTLQYQFTLISFFSMLVSTLMIWILAGLIMHRVLYTHYNSSIPLFTLYKETVLIIILAILANSIGVIITSLYFSHNVAGPIYRIEKTLTELIQTGRAKTVVLRKHDLLKKTISLLNDYLAKIGKSQRGTKSPPPK